MYWIFSIIGAALVGGLLVFVTNREFLSGNQSHQKDSAVVQEHWKQLEQTPITADSVKSVAFSQALRGYNVDEVDAYLARISDVLAEHHITVDIQKETP